MVVWWEAVYMACHGRLELGQANRIPVVFATSERGEVAILISLTLFPKERNAACSIANLANRVSRGSQYN